MAAVTMCGCGTSTPVGQTPFVEQEYATASKVNKASLRFFHETYKIERKNDNMCVSPASASWALSMAATGARSTTATQLYKALGFDTPDAEAIEDAKVNSEINGITNTLFYAGDMKGPPATMHRHCGP